MTEYRTDKPPSDLSAPRVFIEVVRVGAHEHRQVVRVELDMVAWVNSVNPGAIAEGIITAALLESGW